MVLSYCLIGLMAFFQVFVQEKSIIKQLLFSVHIRSCRGPKDRLTIGKSSFSKKVIIIVESFTKLLSAFVLVLPAKSSSENISFE